MEQRYQAVLLVIRDGESVVDVSRQTVHSWLLKYENRGLSALADRTHRPRSKDMVQRKVGFDCASVR